MARPSGERAPSRKRATYPGIAHHLQTEDPAGVLRAFEAFHDARVR
jgi:hypothetical protein